jgi:SlyX protein
MTEKRLVEIETKVAFQDNTIKELNDIIYQHQKEIDRLTTLCESLLEQSKAQSPNISYAEAKDEKPPHY